MGSRPAHHPEEPVDSNFLILNLNQVEGGSVPIGGIRFETSKLDLVRQAKQVVTDATFNE